MDLTALDHVIKLNCKPFDKGGCFYHTPINKILVKDHNMILSKLINFPYNIYHS